MTQSPSPQQAIVAPDTGPALPALFAPDPAAARRFIEFFTTNIRNPNTRKAYARAVGEFAAWCDQHALRELRGLQPVHVAAYIEGLQQRLAAPSIKLHLAALRMLFDWLVVGQVVPVNPASAVRGPRYSVKKGKTPVLAAEEVRVLLDSIDQTSPLGLRDRALIGLMVYTFARVGAALHMRVEDVFVQAAAPGCACMKKAASSTICPATITLSLTCTPISRAPASPRTPGFLFRSAPRRAGDLTDRPLSQADAWRMIRRRALDAGIMTRIGNHSFRATGITEYLRNGGKLEIAQQMANHESARTTGLYDRRNDRVSLDEVERIVI